jgi:hypothetical protein
MLPLLFQYPQIFFTNFSKLYIYKVLCIICVIFYLSTGNFRVSRCQKTPSKHFAMRGFGILSDHVFRVAGGA